MAWARARKRAQVCCHCGPAQRSLEQRGPDAHSSFIRAVSETTATLCHLPVELPMCPEYSQNLTWPGRRLRVVCSLPHNVALSWGWLMWQSSGPFD